MKIELERKSFINEFQSATLMAGKSKMMAMLDNALIKLKGNTIYASSFDGECTILKKWNILSSEQDISFCIEPKSLISALKSIKEDNCTIELNDDLTSAKISHKRGAISLPLYKADEYPQVENEETKVKLNVDAETLYNWFKVARNFTATDDLRPAMTGVYLFAENNQIGVAATDAHILYTDAVDFTLEEKDNVNAIIRGGNINAIMDIINGNENVQISFGDKTTSFLVNNAKITCRNIESRFPNFRAILPKDNTILASLDKNELIDSINRVMIAANPSTMLIKMSFSGMMVNIEAEDFDYGKKAKDECMCTSNSEITIGVKGSFLQNILNNSENNTLNLEMSTPNRAVVAKDENKPNMTMLLMPMALD